MSAEIDNLVLEHLRALRAGQTRIEHVLSEHGHRLTALETAILGVRRDAANDAMSTALQTERMDRLQARLDRIEIRLELNDA